MKKKALAIFKYPRHHWNIPVIQRFSNYYDTESIYISDIKNKNFIEIINEINNLIKSSNIEIVIFDVDYFKFINFFFIDKINSKKKILITGDDFELHEINSITASACDIVLSACPLSVLKYKEKGYQAYFIPFESGKINKNNSIKEIDVLFFGELTSDRKELLSYIVKEGINLKNVGYNSISSKLSDDELLKLILKSKIILNLSKSRSALSIKNYSSDNIFKFYYQFKGRIWDAGLNGVACVSEYSPGQEIFFKEDEIPTFFKKEDCVKILQNLLKNDELLLKYTNKFTSKVHDIFEEKKNFEPIYNAIEKKMSHERVKLFQFPYWYLRIAAKQIILRNIKLSTLKKAIFQFKIIFSIIKNSNFLIKFLITFESVINIFCYSFVLTFKSKK